MKRISALLCGVAIAACASTSDTVEPVESTTPPAEASAEPTRFELAMGTVQSLSEAGNEQVAVDRLTQLLGDPALEEDQVAYVLLKRAELR